MSSCYRQRAHVKASLLVCIYHAVLSSLTRAIYVRHICESRLASYWQRNKWYHIHEPTKRNGCLLKRCYHKNKGRSYRIFVNVQTIRKQGQPVISSSSFSVLFYKFHNWIIKEQTLNNKHWLLHCQFTIV